MARLSELRSQADLYFDSGDCIKAGNLAVPLRQEPVWDVLADLGCTVSCLGNRETHVLEAAFHAKIAGVRHPLLCANLRRRDGSRPLLPTLEIVKSGLRIGIVAVMVPMVTERMKTHGLSAYLWEPAIPTAVQLGDSLRPHVDLLIALTHIGYRQDLALAEATDVYDIIFGGHSHTVLEEPVKIGTTAICQGGSHSKYAGVYEWNEVTGLTGGLVPL